MEQVNDILQFYYTSKILEKIQTDDTWDMGDYLPRKYFDYVCKKYSVKV